MRLTCALATLLLAAISALWADSPTATLRTVDGRAVRGTVTRLDAQQVTLLAADQKSESFPRADVLALEFAEKAPDAAAPAAGRHTLVLRDGSRIPLESYTIADGVLSGHSESAGDLTVPLERVACLLRPRADERLADVERQYESLRLPADAKDHVIMAKKTGPWVPVAGVVKAANTSAIAFSYEGAETLLESETVPVIQFAQVKLDLAPPAGHAMDVDGGRLAFTAVEWADGGWRLTSPSLGAVKVDAGRLASLRFRSDRLVFLSDLAPASVQETGYFDKGLAWQRDRAIGGRPMRLGGTAYEKGLGLHSRTEIAYDLGGEYRTFSAVAGIDESSPFGAATLTVTGDGKTLFEKTKLSRQDAPKPLRLDVAGVKRLTILVDFGDGAYGAGERIDLADAKIVK